MSTQVRPSSSSQKRPNVSNPPSSSKKSNSNLSPYQSAHQNSQQKTYSNSPKAMKSSQNTPQTTQNGGVNPQKRSHRQELLVMTIDLGDGTKDLLKVFEGEDPFNLARDFCEKHGLNPQLIEPLAQNIYGNMEQVLKESMQTLDMYGGAGSQTEPAEDVSESIENNGDTANYRHQEDAVVEGKRKPGSEKKSQPQYNNNQYPAPVRQQQQGQGQHQGHYQGHNQAIRYEHQQQENREEEDQVEDYQGETGEDYREEKYHSGHSGQYYSGEGEVEGRGTGGSGKYEDEPEMYEMVDPEENNSAGNMMPTMKSMESPMGHGLTEKDLRVSKESKQALQRSLQQQQGGQYQHHQHQQQQGQGQHQQSRPLKNQIERKVNSALVQNNSGSEMEKRQANSEYPMGDKLGRSWASGAEFQNEEEYLDYLITSQYGNGKEKQSSTGRYELTHIPNINQASRQMMENKPHVGKIPVYERLHAEGKNRLLKRGETSNLNTTNRISQQTPTQNPQQLNRNNSGLLHSHSQSQSLDINYGTLLYHRGVKKNEEKQKRVVERKKEKLEELSKECTFNPELNRISRQLMSTKARFESLPDKLIQSGLDVKDKMERARNMKQALELEECTFQPEVNIISAKIDNEKSKMTYGGEQDRCLRLYGDSRNRMEIQKSNSRMLSPECTFKPMTNSYFGSPLANTTFEQRSKKFEDRLERINYLRQIKQEAEVYDPETGEPLFHPKIGRAPKMGRNGGNLPIGDFLYNQQYKMADNKRKLYENQQRSVQENMARLGPNSQAIIDNMMRRRLEEIFRKLDHDGDGFISSSKIDISPVGTEVLETLAPLLCEMEEKNQTLDFEAFCEETEKLLRTLTVAERDNLLLNKKGDSQNQSFSFKPEINQRSEKLAQKKRPYGDFHSLYGTYMDDRRRKEERIREAHEMKHEEELRECSFKPKLFSNPRTALSPENTSNYLFDQFIL